ncbi:hypothetical protein PQU95_10590 [Vogesella sp. DC21W]|uniref:Uncharacterized protein n=1 Tax=Vogesella aquatica TaxID=2984206 RepID=A0ABT5IYK5_9NEIS|nr:hypothetical protein [Vogesella aquatica]MDC7717659.1 hypothetical protein [Vogesella aquatica]
MQIGNTRAIVGAFYTSDTNRTNSNLSSPTNQGEFSKIYTDTVSISDTSNQATTTEEVLTQRKNLQGTTDQIDSVEKYQVPSWYAHYGEEVANKLGTSANWHAEKDKSMLSASSADRSEFAALIDKHYQEVLSSNGIKTTEQHYNATILNRELSESLRKQMLERVRNDPKLVDLSYKMGK